MTSMNGKSLALATVLATLAVAGCGTKTTEAQAGNAKISVSALAQSDINHITLTISQGAAVPGNTTAMSDIALELTKVAATGNQWTASISNVPAGSARVFNAKAYKSAGTSQLIYEGETVASVTAGGTATVTILLQEKNPTPGPTRYAPQITSLTLSNAYVLPSTPVAIYASAVSPDGLGGTLNYQWSSTCDAGSGSFTPPSGSGASISTVFLPPNVNATCQLALLVRETANAANKNTPLSVTTFVTVVVNANFGKANVTAFPNSAPIISVLGDFRYNYFTDVTAMPVGQQGDFQFAATDPDGDNVKYTLSTRCGASLAAAAAQPNLAADYFWYLNGITYVGHAAGTDGTAFTTTGSTGVAPPLAYTSEWKPHFGGASDGFNFSDPAADCIFTLTVQDLCTAGNCGTGQGSIPDGQPKQTTIGGVVVSSAAVGVINATHPSKPTRAPVVEAVATVNQDGPAASGVQSWDPQKIAFVDINLAYNLEASADDRWESATSAPSVAWSCNTGSLSAPVNTAGTYAFGAGVKNVTSAVVLSTGASVPPNAACTATFTSPTSGTSTVVTFRFLKKDPCAINNLPNGAACSSGNLCLTGETCLNFVCQAGSAVVCPVADGQCQNPVCDPATGCGISNKANGTSCNKDSNGCTSNDSCVSGACTAGAAVTCNTPADAQCQSANGTCQSTGNNSFTCNYVNLADGTACNKDNNGCTQNDSCAAGACTVGTAVTCTNGTNPCQVAAGSCNSTGPNNYTCAFANVANGTACNVAGTCVAGQTCQVGACQGGTPACPAGQACSPTTPAPTCSPSVVAPQVARDLFVSPPAGLSIDSSGNTYAAANFTLNSPTNFGGVSLRSTGGNDIFVAKYDSAGNVAWAKDIGDDDGVSATDQTANGSAVNNSGRVAIIGKIAGAVTFGADTVSSASGISYVAALAGADGARLWAKGFDLGPNGAFTRISASPIGSTGRFAVCGQASKAAISLVPGVTYGGLVDAVVAVFDNAGNKLWAVQLNTAGNELCNAVAIDDSGDVFAAGQFDGASLPFPGGPTLTGPATTARKFLWVAKFNGNTGATLAAVAYSGATGGILPQVGAVNAGGDFFVGGNFSGSPTIGAALTSAGSDDAFVAKFDKATLAPAVNAVRIGGTQVDTIKGLAITSYGDVVATGTINPSSAAFKAGNGGFDTTGISQLAVNGASSPDQFVVKLNGTSLGREDAKVFGDAGTQNGDSVVVNRYTTGATRDAITLGGTLTGSASYGAPAGTLTAGNAIDQSLVFATLQ